MRGYSYFSHLAPPGVNELMRHFAALASFFAPA